MMRNAVLGIVLVLLLSSLAIAIHTPETRYSVEQTSIEQRNILFSDNRFEQGYVKPFGGFGMKGASRGNFGFKGEEEGASNLATNSFLNRGRNPGSISRYYASARGYQWINNYVRLGSIDIPMTMRPQINGTPQGHARVLSGRRKDVTPTEATVYLRTLDLPPIGPEYVYEGWVIDEDTGYSLSLGIFQSKSIGRTGRLDWTATIPLDPFESIAVTVEPFPDEDPRPGTVILTGSIHENMRSPLRSPLQ